jgi:uncharacterized protein (TIGR00369 family)
MNVIQDVTANDRKGELECGPADHPVASAYLPTYNECYVCGQTHARGLRIRFFKGDLGHVHAHFRPDRTQTSYENVVHGGVISALLDELLGWPIALQTGRMAFTAELTVRFVKPMNAGNHYLATARPGVDHGRYWEGEGDVCDEHGAVYAKAHGKYFLMSEQQTAEVVERLTYLPEDFRCFATDDESNEVRDNQGWLKTHQ